MFSFKAFNFLFNFYKNKKYLLKKIHGRSKAAMQNYVISKFSKFSIQNEILAQCFHNNDITIIYCS
jgi:hypothetical protein